MESIYCWVVAHSNTGNNNSVAIACKNEIQAESYIKKLDNFTNFKIFDVDFYGSVGLKDIKTMYGNKNLHIHSNNICVKTVYDLIYK